MAINTTTTTTSPSPKTCVACVHPIHGGRAAPWCKLLAIRNLMDECSSSSTDTTTAAAAATQNTTNTTASSIEYIVYLDSDAFVNQLDTPISTTT